MLAVVAFACASDAIWHWFVIPVTLCGIIIGTDGIDWIRGRRDIYDPVGILGLFGFHFFFLAPLLHVYWDSWMRYVQPPPDWRDWLGAMGCLNLAGLLLYRTVGTRTSLRAKHLRSRWILCPTRFKAALCIALLATGMAQIAVYVRYGGISGYIAAYEARDGAFEGMGIVFLVSESFPILAMMGYAVSTRSRRRLPGWAEVVAVLTVFLVLKVLFGGLRGSRSNTIWGMFWAVGIIHYWVRPVSRRAIALGLVAMILFMYVYGFYKAAGRDGVSIAVDGIEGHQQLAEHTGRTFESLLLGDLGRADVQAFLLYRQLKPDSDYQYALGRTYLGSLALLIPRQLWPDRPPTKVKEGTELQYGASSFVPGYWQSSLVYGLTGEAMLNFGPIGAVASFTALGALVAWTAALRARLDSEDCRWLLYPFAVLMSFTLFVSDSDNILFSLIKNGFVPMLVVAVGSAKGQQEVGGRQSAPTVPQRETLARRNVADARESGHE